MIEEVAVAIELADLKNDIAFRYVDQVSNTEQQVEALSYTDIKVLRDLIGSQHTIMDSDHSNVALPDSVVRGFVSQGQCEAIIPASQRTSGFGICCGS